MAFNKRVPALDLSKLTDEELAAELKAREQKKNQPPKLLDNPDWSGVVKYVTESVEEAAKPDGYVKDFETYLFEEVMKTLYGKGFWDWWNKGPCERTEG